jgi:hypothetical protein
MCQNLSTINLRIFLAIQKPWFRELCAKHYTMYISGMRAAP